jgi:uncharacterized protein YbbC (DUF1343 family)
MPLRLLVAIVLIRSFLLAPPSVSGQPLSDSVLPGIDVLLQGDLAPLAGAKVGLITNHTGLSRDGIPTIDLLHESDSLDLVALFSPEHGIRGDLDRAGIEDGRDEKTGLPIYSLYGKSRRPTPEMLQGLEALVFDIQDIGCRFYTYIGTLSLAMEEAGKAGIRVVVLDRPNPIGGVQVQGAIPPASLCGGITCIHPIPTRHGMTVGELALLFNRHYGVQCDLQVIPMQGWQRDLYYDRTGLLWVNPSPNMKTLNGALLYPGLGICEATNLSCARGTARPFEHYGAPYLEPFRVKEILDRVGLRGLRFVPFPFVPTTPGHDFEGERCEGLFAVIQDRDRFDPVLAGLHFIQSIHRAHPDRYFPEKAFPTLAGDPDLWEKLTQEDRTPESILAQWEKDLEAFRTLREDCLLYE